MATQTQNKSENVAIKLLSKGLQEVAHQLIEADLPILKEKSGIKDAQLRKYIKGNVPSYETGKKVLKIARSIIIKREREIKKLVAA